ncbi:hypothetical protein D3C87_1356800 [compost metagenome]
MTPYVLNQLPSCKNQVSALYIRLATLASKPSFPVSPYPPRNFKSLIKLTSLKKGSCEIRHPADRPGKNPHLFLGANLLEPS